MPKFESLKGKKVNITFANYRIDWDKPSLSKAQFKVKQFLRPFWENHVVCEELPLAGNKRMRIDIYNATLKIAVEYDGEQHDNYNPFFHNGSISLYRNQIIRDNNKDDYCEINGIKLIRIKPEDLKVLSKEWFFEKWGLKLEK